jgi:hypothetical protein
MKNSMEQNEGREILEANQICDELEFEIYGKLNSPDLWKELEQVFEKLEKKNVKKHHGISRLSTIYFREKERLNDAVFDSNFNQTTEVVSNVVEMIF